MESETLKRQRAHPAIDSLNRQQKAQIWVFACDIENGQKFVGECPDAVLIDQITFTTIG
jgi:hypothetical protein